LLPVQEPEIAVWPAHSARCDPVGECPQRLNPADAAGALPRIPAAADVDLYGRAVAVEADFEEPVGCGRPTFQAPLPLLLPLFCRGDRCPHLVEGAGEPGLQGAESGQVGRQIGHVPSLHQNSNTCSIRGMAQHRVDHLTATQERILRCIRQAITDRGEAPTVAEIGEAVGMSSRASVHYQLGELEAKAAIRRERGRPRGIRLA